MPIHARYIDALDIMYFTFTGVVTHGEVQSKATEVIAKVPPTVRAEVLDFSEMEQFDVGFGEVMATLKLIQEINQDALWEKSYYLVKGGKLSPHVVTMITSLSKVIGAQYSIDVSDDLEEALATMDLPGEAVTHFTASAVMAAQ
ncbi:hypothetical protein BXY66_3842 [Shimia isoporae]|uniref:Uncharacterized protein n=1 Tax=Shimia isoporae TaxID=647720 RepID=A0A4V2Q1Y2_9RHOB|nr:hypothetical protein [Shimia isoporae]TCK99340.1 hypothetical protein BXY66_3842 [Shimia isoporae]